MSRSATKLSGRILAEQFRRHRLQTPPEEHVQEQRLDDVIPMMTQRDLGDAVLGGKTIQSAAAQPRAQAAHGLAVGDDAFDHGIGVLLDDAESNAQVFEVPRQDLGGKTRLLLIQIDGGDFEAHRRAALQAQQNVEQGIGILAAGHAHHDVIAVGDHLIVGNGLAHGAAQLRLQLLEIIGRAVDGLVHTCTLKGSRDISLPSSAGKRLPSAACRWLAS
jgi:hypothetical protein